MSVTTTNKLFSRQYAVSLDEKIRLSDKRSQDNMRKIGELKASLSSLLTTKAPSSSRDTAAREEVRFPHVLATGNTSQMGSSSTHVAEYLEKAQQEIKRLTETNHELVLECVRLKEAQNGGNMSDIVHSPKASMMNCGDAPDLVEEVESFVARLVASFPELLAEADDSKSVGAENVCALLHMLEEPIIHAITMSKTAEESLETNADLVDLARKQEEERGVDYKRLVEITTALEQTNRLLKEDAKKREGVIVVLQENESELRNSLDVLLGEKEDLEAKLKQAVQNSEDAAANAKEASASLVSSSHTDSTVALASHSEQIALLTGQLGEKDAAAAEMSEKVEAAFHRNIALVEEKLALQQNVDSLTLKVEELTHLMHATQVEKDTLTREKEEAASANTDKDAAASAAAEERGKLVRQMAEPEKEKNAFNDKVQALHTNLQEAQKQNTIIQTELEALKANERTLAQEKLTIATIVSEKDNRIYELEDEKKKLQEQLEQQEEIAREPVASAAEDNAVQQFIDFKEIEDADSDDGFSYPEPAALSEWLESWNAKSINDVYPAGEEAQTQLDSAGPLYHVGMCVVNRMNLVTTSKQWQRLLFQVQNTLDQHEETALSVVASDTMQLFFKLLKATGLLDKLSHEVRCALATFSLLFFVSEVTELSQFETTVYAILKHIQAAGECEEASGASFYSLLESASESGLENAHAVLQRCLDTLAQADRLALANKVLLECHFAAERGTVVEKVDCFACLFLFFARAIISARNVTDIRNSLRPEAEIEKVVLRFYALAVPLGVEIARSFPLVQEDILALIQAIRADLEACSSSSYPTLPELMSFIQASVQKLPEGNSVIMSAESFEATQKELLEVYMANELCSHQLNSLLQVIENKQLTA